MGMIPKEFDYQVVERRFYTPEGTFIERVRKNYWFRPKGARRLFRISESEFKLRSISKPLELEVERVEREEERPVRVVFHVKISYESPRGSSYNTFVEFFAIKVFASREEYELRRDEILNEIDMRIAEGNVGGGLSPDHLARIYGKPGFSKEISEESPELSEESVGDLEIKEVKWRRVK
jgi:hypothetical protein